MPGQNKEIAYWAKEPKEVLDSFETSENGLTDEEAARRREEAGENVIKIKKEKGPIAIFFNQFKSALIIALVVAALISLFLEKWTEAGVIIAAVIVNSALGFWQEFKAERALGSLNEYIHKTARVLRGGKRRVIDASKLVPGDVIRVRQGDRVPADARLIATRHLEVDESALTGESSTVKKRLEGGPAEATLADRESMVWTGTMVREGFADAVITATGEQTEFGRIAKAVAEAEEEETPLQRAVSSFSTKVGIGLLAFGILLFILGVTAGHTYEQMFFISLAVIVAAVPEGLPIAMTVVLATGVKRLAERKGVVRRLLAAETLGSTSLILTDKTGTMTTGRMTLEEIIPLDGDGEQEILRRVIVNADVTAADDSTAKEPAYTGEPLEVALVERAEREGLYQADVTAEYEDVDWLPFSSDRMYSATRVEKGEEATLTLLGAPEVIAEYAELPEERKAEIIKEVERRAGRGERVIAAAWKEVAPSENDMKEVVEKRGFAMKALLSFRDPLRPQVADAVKHIKKAGVNTVIVTGDHAGTARFIAESVGIIDDASQVITGAELDKETDWDATIRERDIRVFARVTPHQKVELVRLYKERGDTVAVTGDGVNDAPALKTAHIGVAMGSGTDVARGASDLVMLDNNYSTIVHAIEEGRRILANIRKVIIFLLSDSFDEIILIGGSLLAGLVLPLNALQILYIKFFTDVFPSLAFTFERGEESSNKGEALGVRYNLFDRQTRWYTLIRGVFASGFLFALYWLLLDAGFDPATVRTFIFASVSTYILFLAFSMRRLNKTILSYNPFSNMVLNMGILFGIAMSALAVYLPWLQDILGTVALSWQWVAAVLVVGAINMTGMEILKAVFQRVEKRNNNE